MAGTNPPSSSSSETPINSNYPPISPTPSTSSTPAASSVSQWLANPFGVTWRAALVKAPRLVPLSVLKITCPEGPFPFIYDFQSPRGGHIIPLYIWIPNLDSEQRPSYPVILDFHGGGFILGSCLEQAPFCAQMCTELRSVVISVDYRMGPASKFPAANWDAEDVLKAVLDVESIAGVALRESIVKKNEEQIRQYQEDQAAKQKGKNYPSTRVSYNTAKQPGVADILDSTRIAISGFSSGGNLALNLGLHLNADFPQEEWPSMFPPSYPHSIPLLLFYPSLDARLLPSQRPQPQTSRSSPLPTPAPDPAANPSFSDILAPSYLPREHAAHPRASPGLADVKSSLHAKAKMLLVLPQLDSLAVQSEVWVNDVQDAARGTDLEVHRVKGVRHGWTQFPVTWLGEEERRTRGEMFERAREFVREAWANSESST